jgi:hypothetical protein
LPFFSSLYLILPYPMRTKKSLTNFFYYLRLKFFGCHKVRQLKILVIKRFRE